MNYYRKPNRLKDFDYSTGMYYFITICTKDKRHYFGKIHDDEIYYSEIGKIAIASIEKIETVYENAVIEKYIVMPNHIHLILVLKEDYDISISRIIKQYKEHVTKTVGEGIWQKSFYDHIIRNEKDFLRIWQYIDNNVLKWEIDDYYCE